MKAFLDALEVPHEIEPSKDETALLLSAEANKGRLQQAIDDEERANQLH